MRAVTTRYPGSWRPGDNRGIFFIPDLAEFNWRVFVPMFLLYFNYVFGVAAGALGEAQLFLRLFVLFVIVLCVFVSNLKASVGALVIYLSSTIYLLLFFFANGNSVTLNFVYLMILLGFLHFLSVGREELLFNALLVTLFVVLIYLVYFFAAPIDPGEINILGRVRYSFGFSNPNKVGLVNFSLIVLTALYAFKRSYGVIAIPFFIVPAFVVMMYSDSKTALYSTVIFFFLIVAPFSVRLRKILFLLPLMCLLLSIFIATLHDNEVINNLLSERPKYFYQFLSTLNGGDYLFGADSSDFRIDNSYILALFAVGPVGFILVSYLLFWSGRRRLNVYEVSFVISVLVYGIFEGILVRVEHPIILYLYYLVAVRDRGGYDGVLGYFDRSESSQNNRR